MDELRHHLFFEKGINNVQWSINFWVQFTPFMCIDARTCFIHWSSHLCASSCFSVRGSSSLVSCWTQDQTRAGWHEFQYHLGQLIFIKNLSLIFSVNTRCCYLLEPVAFLPLWYSSGLLRQRLGVQIPAQVVEFFIFKKYLCKLPIGNKFQLGKNSIEKCIICTRFKHSHHSGLPTLTTGDSRCSPPNSKP